MAQINLLKQTSTPYDFKETGPKILSRIFLAILVLLVIYYAWLFVESKSINSKISQAQAQINTDSQKALTIQNRDQLLVRQLQIKTLQGLISSHAYWSQLFPELARVTLKTASYTSMKVGVGQDLVLDVTVPTLPDLDKYLQIFDLSQFNNNFSNVRISGFNKVQGSSSQGASSAVQFEVNMTYNPSLIQYNTLSGK